jgi:hypothetical protein
MRVKFACSSGLENAACERSPAIRQIAETEVVRIRHGVIARTGEAILGQKDEAVMVRMSG